MKKNQKVLNLTKFSILLAIEAIFCFTPLGSLPALGPIVATLAMVPVIITAILMGPKYGSLMGFFAGLFSLLIWSFAPPNPLFAFVFSPFYSLGTYQGGFGSLIICFVPRILTGTVAGGLSRLFMKQKVSSRFIRYSVSGFLGSMVNTLLVVFGIILFFGSQYSTAAQGSLLAIMGGTIVFSGIPEAIIAGLVAFAVCRPLEKQISRKS